MREKEHSRRLALTLPSARRWRLLPQPVATFGLGQLSRLGHLGQHRADGSGAYAGRVGDLRRSHRSVPERVEHLCLVLATRSASWRTRRLHATRAAASRRGRRLAVARGADTRSTVTFQAAQRAAQTLKFIGELLMLLKLFFDVLNARLTCWAIARTSGISGMSRPARGRGCIATT
jgi:hypothetical protein